MQGEQITLQNIKGIGDKISEKIINSVGGEEELQKIVDDVDVEKISEYVAVNAIFYSSYIALEGEKDDDMGFATLESRNIILKEKIDT